MGGAQAGQRLSLGTRILISLGLGIAVGLFAGELAEPLRFLGDAFVGLLQMTVLPYIVVSLIANVGRLSPDRHQSRCDQFVECAAQTGLIGRGDSGNQTVIE